MIGIANRTTPPGRRRRFACASLRRSKWRSTSQPATKHASVTTSSSHPSGVVSVASRRSKAMGSSIGGRIRRSTESLSAASKDDHAGSRADHVSPLQHRGEEAVAAVRIRRDPEPRAGIERDAGARELGRRIAFAEVGVAGEEALDDRVVLLGQQAACRVDEPPAGLHERRGGVEDRRLLRGELAERRFACAAT